MSTTSSQMLSKRQQRKEAFNPVLEAGVVGSAEGTCIFMGRGLVERTSLTPEERRVIWLVNRGRGKLKEKDLDEALKFAEKAILAANGDPFLLKLAHLLLGDISLSAKDYAGATTGYAAPLGLAISKSDLKKVNVATALHMRAGLAGAMDDIKLASDTICAMVNACRFIYPEIAKEWNELGKAMVKVQR